jgi:hypothetical protein
VFEVVSRESGFQSYKPRRRRKVSFQLHTLSKS